jgi:aminocarboxymuconate-semialdehyde decarboxylase
MGFAPVVSRRAISYMDSLEIATGVLSLTAPSIEGWAGKERADMARRVNDYGADLVQRRPDRFGFFATLAPPDVDAALTEVGRAFDQLKVDGVVLMSNYEGVYLGHPSFEPVWKELDRRGAVVYIHPQNRRCHCCREYRDRSRTILSIRRGLPSILSRLAT